MLNEESNVSECMTGSDECKYSINLACSALYHLATSFLLPPSSSQPSHPILFYPILPLQPFLSPTKTRLALAAFLMLNVVLCLCGCVWEIRTRRARRLCWRLEWELFSNAKRALLRAHPSPLCPVALRVASTGSYRTRNLLTPNAYYLESFLSIFFRCFCFFFPRFFFFPFLARVRV